MAYNSRKTSGINPYAIGGKIYGGGRSFPTMGPVDKLGYVERDAKAKARRNAIVRRMKARSQGNFASPDASRKV